MRKSFCFGSIVLSLLLFAGGMQTRAQGIARVDARLDTNSIRIGEQIRLDLSVVVPVDARVQFPAIGDTLPGMEVVRRDPQDTLHGQDGKNVTYRQRFYLTRFDTGYVVIEPFQFIVADPASGRIDSLSTEAQLVSVRTVPVDTSRGFKDIKPILDVPFTWRDALPYAAGLLLAALIAYFVYRYLRRRKHQPAAAPKVVRPSVPAHVRALEALDRIEAEKLWQQGRIKDYYTQVTDVLRIFLEERFGISAPEMTSDELLERMRRKVTDTRSMELLRSVLVLADLVKFAKAHPLPDEHEQLIRECREIIHLNRPLTAGDVTESKEGAA
jgi:hypothetical protein